MPLVLNSSSITGLAAVGGLSSPQTGSVLQVVSANTTTFVSTTSSTPSDTTLSASITPTSLSSKIAIFVSQTGTERSSSSITNGIDLYLVRNSTTIFQWAVALGYTNTTLALITNSSVNYLDSPATTSSVTYKTQYGSYNNSGSVRMQSNSDRSTIVLMEIAG